MHYLIKTTYLYYINMFMRGVLERITQTQIKRVYCWFGYTKIDKLWRTDMRAHSGEKPFVCSQCNYSCNQAGRLRIHMWIHSGGKPYNYQQCKYSSTFSQKAHSHSFMEKSPFIASIVPLPSDTQRGHFKRAPVNTFRGKAFQLWPVQLFMHQG